MTDRLPRRAVLAFGAALSFAAALPARAQEDFVFGVQTLGDPDAPVTVIEYSSLTCPYCARFHREVYPLLKRDYIDTGKVKLEMREVYFDRLGLWAAALARCGGAERYFGFFDLLLEQQEQWARAEDVLSEFKRIGRLGGLSDEQVTACVTDTDKLRKMVEAYKAFTTDPRLTGTPTLIVDGEKIDDPSFRNLSAAIEARLGS